MGDARSKGGVGLGALEQIIDQESHDKIVNKETQAVNVPLVIMVTSSTPRSESLLPSVVELSRKSEFQRAGVKWYEMQLTEKTTPMIKFGPQNCPILVLMRGLYCETLLGVRGVKEVENRVQQMLDRP